MKKFLAKILTIIAIILIIIATAYGIGFMKEAIVTMMEVILTDVGIGSILGLAALSLGLAVLIDSETTSNVLSNYGDGLADAGSALVGGVSKIIGGAASAGMSGLMSSMGMWLLIGVGGYIVYNDYTSSKGEQKHITSDAKVRSDASTSKLNVVTGHNIKNGFVKVEQKKNDLEDNSTTSLRMPSSNFSRKDKEADATKELVKSAYTID